MAGRVVSLDVDGRVVAEAEEHLRAFPERTVRPSELRRISGGFGDGQRLVNVWLRLARASALLAGQACASLTRDRRTLVGRTA